MATQIKYAKIYSRIEQAYRCFAVNISYTIRGLACANNPSGGDRRAGRGQPHGLGSHEHAHEPGVRAPKQTPHQHALVLVHMAAVGADRPEHISRTETPPGAAGAKPALVEVLSKRWAKASSTARRAVSAGDGDRAEGPGGWLGDGRPA